MPRIFANSILSKNAQEAIDKIQSSQKFSAKQKVQATRIIKKLFSSKSRKQATNEAAESRIDYISDHLGIVKEEVIQVVNLLREEKILADTKDLTAFIKRGENKNRSLRIVKEFSQIEKFLLGKITEEEKTFHIKELNEQAEEQGCKKVSPRRLKTILNFWTIKNWIKRTQHGYSQNQLAIIANYSHEELKQRLDKRHTLARFIVEFLFSRSNETISPEEVNKEQLLVEFSVHELKQRYESKAGLFKPDISIQDVEDALFYLSRIEAIKVEGGFLVVYNKLTIERLELNNNISYKNADYQKLKEFYENKIQQIHIVGEYAKKMLDDYKEALQFVEDYFHLNYSSFLNKYFNTTRQKEIKRTLTPKKFRELFGELSPAQLRIINDKDSTYIAVIAGPGSGKTRVLVHKLASLLLMEDIKHEQLLMLTFSRAAATEFKKRLLELIGNAAGYIEIKTFHSYCFDLLGKIGSIDKSDTIIRQAVEQIKSREILPNRITKMVLVIDEAQDMNAQEFELIQTLIHHNEEMRVIAVGDDDQNIYEFRQASSRYLEQFLIERKAKKYELIENYRSKQNLVELANQFAGTINHRLKETPVIAHQKENGSIKLTQYTSSNLIEPLVRDVLSTDLSGTICILTQTNDEAAQIAGLLNNSGLSAKLIQTNDGFSLHNLQEVRFFMQQLNLNEEIYMISEEQWKHAKRRLWDTYKESKKIDICINLIKEFELSNPKKKYHSDFEVFIKESKLEDFAGIDSEKIAVSTIHKAKGKEFDHVFLMLDRFSPATDEKKRQLYVAMTRAKQKLSIHLNGTYLRAISVESMEYNYDNNVYAPPDLLIVHLTHKDIWLDFFISKQHLVSNLKSGDVLAVNREGCLDQKGNLIVKFSKAFQEKITSYENKGYQLSGSVVNYVVYWQKKDTDLDIKIILPEITFSRVTEEIVLK